MSVRRIVFVGAVGFLGAILACGGNTPAPPPSPSLPVTAPSPSAAATPATTAKAVSKKPPAAGEIFARMKGDLVSCYEEGRRAIPTMTSGKVTYHAAVDPSGKTSCVVPSDDTGLTQEVEDCMRARLEREAYDSTGGPWSVALPIVVRDKVVSLGKPSELAMIDTIESHGLSEEMYAIVDGLLPELQTCMRTIDRSADRTVVYVGGRVDKDGKVACALASSASAIPVSTRDCAATVLSRARFRAPKRGYGLISIPLELH